MGLKIKLKRLRLSIRLTVLSVFVIATTLTAVIAISLQFYFSRNIRRQLKAAPQDRWMVISVRGKGDERRRRFEYYDDEFRLREASSEKSDYDPSLRPWFTNARKDHIFKTDPYLFQHLQLPGQSYSIRLPEVDAVLTVDITLSSLSDYLMTQDLGNQAEVYMYQKSGELIASNLSARPNRELPEVPVLELSTEQQAYIHRAGKIRVSNEMDWPPIDYAISGQPQGYSVDLMRMIAGMTGMYLSCF